MMDNPFFTMIIPAYNSAEYIRPALDSIKAQTFRDYELICVCDSCRDNTAEICREYTDLVYEVEYGAGGQARDKGLDVARGEWILFCDDDDWLMHDKVFQYLADNVGKHGEDLFCFSFYWNGRGYTEQRADQRWSAVWNKAWRRSFIGETRHGPRKNWGDENFNNATLAKNPKEWYSPEALYYYNFNRPGSTTWRWLNGEIKYIPGGGAGEE